MIGYIRTSAMSINTVFNAILDDIALVKDGDGNLFVPSQAIDQIGNMEPGKGYKIKMINSNSILYDVNTKKSESLAPVPSYLTTESHYPRLSPTGNNAVIIIPAQVLTGKAETGDEIAVYNQEGLLVGSGRYSGNNLGITIWGDDLLTERIEGLTEGEQFIVRLYSREENQEIECAGLTWKEGDDIYEVDKISIVSYLEVDRTTDNSVSAGIIDAAKLESYPNPFSSGLSVEFHLEEESQISIHLYNQAGALIKTITSGIYPAGAHTVSWNLQTEDASIPDGIYFVLLKTDDRTVTKKIIKD